MPGPARPASQGRRAVSTADEQLLELVWQEHGRALKAATMRWLSNDHAAAEDVLQETLFRLWQNREVISNGRGSLRGWLFRVAHNLCIDKARRRGARPPEIRYEDEVDVAPPLIRDHAELVDTALELRAALDTLSPQHREIIERVYFYDQSAPEIAAELRIPPGTVKSRAYYALRALQAAMKPPDEV
jgi:RNA polymerase sigma-70 factor (ECF subfamily)